MSVNQNRLAAVIAFAIILIIGLGVTAMGNEQYQTETRATVRELGMAQGRVIEEYLNRALSATYALASIIKQSTRIDNFDQLASDMMQRYGGIDGLFIAPDGVVSLMYPVTANEAAFGYNLLTDLQSQADAYAAIESRQLYLVGPFALQQGGMGLSGRYPVFRTNPRTGMMGFWGFTIALINLDRLLHDAHLAQLAARGYDYELSRPLDDSDARDVFAESIAGPMTDPERIDVTLPGATWELAIEPVGGWGLPPFIPLALTLTLLASTLIAGLIYHALGKSTALAQEVEAHRRDAEALRRQNKFIDDALGALTIPFYVINAHDFTVQYANRAAAEKMNLSPGLTCYMLRHWHDRPCNSADHTCPLNEVVQTGKPAVTEQIHYTGGRPHYIEVFGYPIFDDSGQVVQMIEYAQDITERRLAEQAQLEQEKLAVALAKEREANQMQRMFLINASHQIRTPLTIISSSTEVLAGYWDRLSPDSRAERLERITEQVKHLAKMLDDISTIISSDSHSLAYNPCLLDLAAWCSSFVQRFQHDLDNRYSVSFSADPDLGPVYADPSLLNTVLQNLLSNATKYSPEGSEIRVRLQRDTDGVMLEVSDDGIGIPPHDQPHIFEPYYRGSNTEGVLGSGLGLKVVYEIVARSGGQLDVESEQGKGTTFRIWLPATAGVETVQSG